MADFNSKRFAINDFVMSSVCITLTHFLNNNCLGLPPSLVLDQQTNGKGRRGRRREKKRKEKKGKRKEGERDL